MIPAAKTPKPIPKSKPARQATPVAVARRQQIAPIRPAPGTGPRADAPAALNRPSAVSTRPNNQILLALLTALAIHALVIFGIGFDFEPPAPPDRRLQKLEVTVIRTPMNQEVPDNPDFAAQTSQVGGGVQEEKILPTPKTTNEPMHNPDARAGSPLPPAPQPEAQVGEAVPRPSPKSQADIPKEKRQSEVLTAKTLTTTPKKTQSEPELPRMPTASDIINSRATEVSRLSEQLEERSNAYAKRPRRKVITASTKEFKYAAYLEAWKRKVEQVGNLNFPDEARQKKVYGNLVLHVALKADGTVETVRLVYSSGHKLLDEAAEHIVRMAAPFAPFPDNIRSETDVLDIIRTWQFLSTNRFSW